MMHVRVGPFDYEVSLVTGYIRYEQEDCLGLCDNEQHQLLISDRTTSAQRVAVFCHEYMEAWLYHFGDEKQTKEGYCDLFGLAMAQFIQQFAPDFAIDQSVVARDANELKVTSSKLKVTERIVRPEPGHGL